MPVAFGVAARTRYSKEMPSSPRLRRTAMKEKCTESGDYGGDYGHAYRGTPGPAETREPQVISTSAQVAAGHLATALRALAQPGVGFRRPYPRHRNEDGAATGRLAADTDGKPLVGAAADHMNEPR